MEKKLRKNALTCAPKRLSLRGRTSNTCIVCPLCTVSVRGNDAFKTHYKQEIEKMRKPFENLNSKQKFYRMKLRSSLADDEDEDAVDTHIDLEERKTELKNIKKRKYNRYAEMFLLSTNKKIKKDPCNQSAIKNSQESRYDLFSCTVCNEFLESTDECVTKHLAKCFAKKELEFDLYSSSESEDEEMVEEFSWAGQTWIRASSLLDDDYLRREGKLTRLEMDDCDEELDVDVDNTETYGNQQFCEVDVIPSISDESGKKAQQMLREALSVGGSSSSGGSRSETPDACSTYWNGGEACEEEFTIETLENISNGDKNKLVDLLKEKLLKVEHKLDIDVAKCPICMAPYSYPVVSTSCWHVCCSECWMRALGTKKLCPKCNNIVAPSQLRKIYL